MKILCLIVSLLFLTFSAWADEPEIIDYGLTFESGDSFMPNALIVTKSTENNTMIMDTNNDTVITLENTQILEHPMDIDKSVIKIHCPDGYKLQGKLTSHQKYDPIYCDIGGNMVFDCEQWLNGSELTDAELKCTKESQ